MVPLQVPLLPGPSAVQTSRQNQSLLRLSQSTFAPVLKCWAPPSASLNPMFWPGVCAQQRRRPPTCKRRHRHHPAHWSMAVRRDAPLSSCTSCFTHVRLLPPDDKYRLLHNDSEPEYNLSIGSLSLTITSTHFELPTHIKYSFFSPSFWPMTAMAHGHNNL